MENKKTSELLDLLNECDEEKGDYEAEGKYAQIWDELQTREPFCFLIGSDNEDLSFTPSISNAVEEMRDDIKKLKRHGHKEGLGEDRVVIAL